MKKIIELNGETFVIRNIGFVFNNFEGTAYRILPNRKIFKYQRVGLISFPVSTCCSINNDIRFCLNKMLDKEHKEKVRQEKIEEFIKTLDK